MDKKKTSQQFDTAMTCQPQQSGVLGISFWNLVGMDWDKGCKGVFVFPSRSCEAKKKKKKHTVKERKMVCSDIQYIPTLLGSH